MSLVFMSDQIFLLSDQNGALVGHMSFQGKKIICSPALYYGFASGDSLPCPAFTKPYMA